MPINHNIFIGIYIGIGIINKLIMMVYVHILRIQDTTH